MKFIHYLCYVVLLFLEVSFIQCKKQFINIYCNQEITGLTHFWESSGLCPPLPHKNAADYFLSDDMFQNLIHISSVPHQGLKQIRAHWLLEMVKKQGTYYDFTELDKFISILHLLKLKPGFELMGNPSNYFNNFDDITQVTKWKQLVKILASRYIKLFGLDYVSSWNFETWNEPDHKDFDNVTMSVEGFLKYYDACSEGLKEASPSLVFGGPGGSCKKASFSKRCWALFNHVVNGTNYITGKQGSRLDYISFHKKGSGTAREILYSELDTIAKIQQRFPGLSSTPIYNDEADPLVGWSKPQWWRADATYASLIAKVVSQHQNNIVANKSRLMIDYALLSNDNAFLSFSPNYFTQRTLTARFQINNTHPKYVHAVKKPSLTVLGLLSKLGDVQLNKTILHNKIGGVSSLCSASKCSSLEIATVLYNSVDTKQDVGNASLQLTYHEMNAVSKRHKYGGYNRTTEVMAVSCRIDNTLTNPHSVWKQMDSPDFPSHEQLAILHEAEGPSCSEPRLVNFDERGQYTANLSLPLPGVLLHHICWKPWEPPGQPTDLNAHTITRGQVLIHWKDTGLSSKCIQTYDIQFARPRRLHHFVSINQDKIIFNSFVYITKHLIAGSFRVRAMDYWGRFGDFSEILRYNY